MRIDLYDGGEQRLGKVVVDLQSPPAAILVRGADGVAHERYLDWDKTVDDEGRLRKCPVCGCAELYVRRRFPPITGFVIVVVIGLLCFALYGLEVVDPKPLLVTVGLLVLANILFAWLSPRFLTCYRCSSRFHEAGISKARDEWDAAIAGKYRKDLIKPDPRQPSITDD